MDSITDKTITNFQIDQLAKRFNLPLAHVRGVLFVEANEHGFSQKTGKILIQFEPRWMLHFLKIKRAEAGTWINNGVSDQTKEWFYFNLAFKVSANAAMQSTSIGMGQVMGFHWQKLGFRSVGDFWDYNKKSEYNQVECMLRFIAGNKKMYQALRTGDADTFAYYYNGAEYLKFNYANRIRQGIELYA